MVKVRCKFVCQSKRVFKNYGDTGPLLYDYKFSAVYGGRDGASEENKSFWQYTPSGELSVTSVKDGTFEVGREYYLDLIPADGGE